MSWKPEVCAWPGKQAVLFVHGVGNTQPGDYDPLVQQFKTAIGDANAAKTATYFLYYDDVNDWMSAKVRFKDILLKIKDRIKSDAAGTVGDKLTGIMSEYAGDVLFPVVDEAARTMVRKRVIAQLEQMRLDGKAAGVPLFRQRISIICHSLGCFHTYEALHAAANDASLKLRPATDAMKFDNVIFMASPVQLIRTVSLRLGGVVPKDGFATTDPAGLSCPSEQATDGSTVHATDNWVSITGNMDPVGGHLLGHKLAWAYMNVAGQDSKIDPQTLVAGPGGNAPTETELALALAAGVAHGAGPNLSITNPHSWSGYIDRHAGDLQTWFTVA